MIKGRPKLTAEVVAQVRELHAQGFSIRRIQKSVTYENRKGIVKNVSLGSIFNILKYSE